MSRICMICQRGPRVSFQLSHSHRRSKRRWNVNLQKKRVMLQGKRVRGYVCTRCLGSDKAVLA